MTTPVFTEAYDSELSRVSIQVVLPLDKDISKLSAALMFLWHFDNFIVVKERFVYLFFWFVMNVTFTCMSHQLTRTQ